MIKNWSLQIGKKRVLKRINPHRSSVNFHRASRIGVLLDEPMNPRVNEFVQSLNRAGKKVDVLCYGDERLKSGSAGKNIRIFSKKDIGWNGKFKPFFIKKFIKTDFDYLFSFNTSSILPIENILAMSHAKCRIGRFSEKNLHYFEMMISVDNQKQHDLPKHMLQFVQNLK